jgi:hypothetical protein
VPFGSGEDMQGVLMLENFDTSAAFAVEEDQNMVLSLTQQAAMALENARLFAAVEGRAAQLQALTTLPGRSPPACARKISSICCWISCAQSYPMKLQRCGCGRRASCK